MDKLMLQLLGLQKFSLKQRSLNIDIVTNLIQLFLIRIEDRFFFPNSSSFLL